MKTFIVLSLGILLGAYLVHLYDERQEPGATAGGHELAVRAGETVEGARDSLGEKLAQWHLSPDDVKADLARTGRVVREPVTRWAVWNLLRSHESGQTLAKALEAIAADWEQAMSGRRLLALGAALCLMISIRASEAQKLPDDIAASKVIKVAVNSGYPPMEMKDEKTGELNGFDIDLMAAMAKVLGLKVEYQHGAFEAMTPALQSERVNMIMSGFYDVPKRRPMFTFIDYLRAGAQFYTLVSLPEIKELTDLCGKTIRPAAARVIRIL